MVTINVGGSGGGGGGGSSDMLFSQGGTLALRDLVYLVSSGTVAKADATTASTGPAIGFVSSVVSPTQVRVRNERILDGFTGLTALAPLFMSTTPGGVTSTPPSAIGNVIQEVGVAVTATSVLIRLDTDPTVNS